MANTLTDAGPTLRALLAELQGRPVAILGHMRPDGDCIGSQVALARLCLAAGLDAICVNRDRVPPNLASYVVGVKFLTNADYVADGRVALTVDCADATRVGVKLTNDRTWVVFRDGQPHDWKTHGALWAGAGSPVSLGWKEGVLKVQAGGHTFEGKLAEGRYAFTNLGP